MSPRKLLKRPLASAEELETLAAWVAERRSRFRARTRGGLIFAGAFVALLMIAGTGELLEVAATLSVVTVFWAHAAIRRLWTQPRILAAQRRLLQHRGLVDGDTLELLGAESRRLVQRSRKRLAALGADDARLVAAEATARRFLARLAESEEGATTAFRERLRGEQVALRARLEAFRVALVHAEVEALLEPETAVAALDRAVTALDGNGC